MWVHISLGSPSTEPTLAREDSRSAMKWATDSASWSKTRHIGVQAHKIREWISSKLIKVEYCPTSAQLADALTKALPVQTHMRDSRCTSSAKRTSISPSTTRCAPPFLQLEPSQLATARKIQKNLENNRTFVANSHQDSLY